MIGFRSIVFFVACMTAQVIAAQRSYAAAEAAEIESLLAQPAGLFASVKELKGFYAPRAYQPLWSGDAADTAAVALKDTAEAHGLDPTAYTIDETLPPPNRELSISAAMSRLGRDLSTGRIPPYRIVGGVGEGARPRFDGTALLKSLAQTSNPAEILGQYAPQSPDYQGLMAALRTYRDIAKAGGWPHIPEGPAVKPGESDPRIPTVRLRLIATGDLSATDDTGTVLDGETASALKRFQIRHGLDNDGAIGKRTLLALNVDVFARIRQIELSLERLRQLPRPRETTRIEVNIASQTLKLFENAQPTLEMRVVTGDIKHQTPTMITRVAALTVNPTWTVPASIARKEILPKLKRDPNYLTNNNLHIVDGAPQDTEGAGIDWTKMGKSFPFVLRQIPGPDNALGQLKFNLQNQESIYMHDTPQRAFFKRSYRLLSHGCIRLERPLDLADHLLGPEWIDKLPALIAAGKTKSLILKHSLPVYLMYQTAWADTDGSISFRDDSYGNDQRLEQVLKQSAGAGGKGTAPTNL